MSAVLSPLPSTREKIKFTKKKSFLDGVKTITRQFEDTSLRVFIISPTFTDPFGGTSLF